ncbi:MAG TPA: transglutaminase-like domain-containing protein [Fimbriimonas sp.]
MKKLLSILILGLASFAAAEETYLGMYLQGSKIGYTSYTSIDAKLNGKAVRQSDSKTRMGAGLLGAALQIESDSTTWPDPAGRPVKMLFAMRSSGREQKVNAAFGSSEVKLDIENSGTKSQKVLKIPQGAPIVDDPISLVVTGSKARVFYVLDPTTVSFVKNNVRVLGKGSTTVRGKPVQGTEIEMVDPRATTKVWVSAKGDLIKAEAPMGIEMIPVSREEALGKAPAGSPIVDLASATSLKTDREINDPDSLSKLKLMFEGRDLSRVPSDAHQTLNGSGKEWVVTVHPLRLTDGDSISIEEAGKQQAAWVKPSLHIPSDSARFKAIAKEVVGDSPDVRSAALKVRAYVNRTLKPNAGIGVLRDANDVLDTKEGVCRDYAILAATISRAAGIPTRLVSGLVNWDGTFYYHAWVEVWDGGRWLALDPTGGSEQISAAHVKLANGNVEDAFTFTFLEKAKVKVLEMKRD